MTKSRHILPRHMHSCRGSWTPTYYSWVAMVQRCTNPARNVFELYGGRGIKLCDRWKNFEAFLQDMGERPEGTSIGRIDPNGNYEPGNCAWHSDVEQARSRRSNKLTVEKASDIRRRYASGESMYAIARAFGVSRPMVGNIINMRAWV